MKTPLNATLICQDFLGSRWSGDGKMLLFVLRSLGGPVTVADATATSAHYSPLFDVSNWQNAIIPMNNLLLQRRLK